MKNNLWQKCKNCDSYCCKDKTIAHPLFLTQKENDELRGINDNYPCKYLNNKGLCSIHKKRPIDCRLFPFDFEVLNNKIFWCVRNTKCLIADSKPEEFEPLLCEFERGVLIDFRNHIKEYSKHKTTEYIRAGYNDCRILREVKLNDAL